MADPTSDFQDLEETEKAIEQIPASLIQARRRFVALAGIGLLLALSALFFGLNGLPFTPSVPQPIVSKIAQLPKPSPTSEISATSVPIQLPISPPPIPSPLVTPVISVIPTPIAQDIQVDFHGAEVTRFYNDGSGKGDQPLAPIHPTVVNPVWAPISPNWNSSVQACIGIKSTQTVPPRGIQIQTFLDGTQLLGDQFPGSSSLQPGTALSYCRLFPYPETGKHTITFTLNGSRTIEERDFTNNTAALTYEILPDTEKPKVTLSSPEATDLGTCVRISQLSDNVTSSIDLRVVENRDGNKELWNWEDPFCVPGPEGSTHAFSVQVTDESGNEADASTQFTVPLAPVISP